MIEIDNFTKSDFQPYNDDYVYIPIKPKVHQQHFRSTLTKLKKQLLIQLVYLVTNGNL